MEEIQFGEIWFGVRAKVRRKRIADQKAKTYRSSPFAFVFFMIRYPRSWKIPNMAPIRTIPTGNIEVSLVSGKPGQN